MPVAVLNSEDVVALTNLLTISLSSACSSVCWALPSSAILCARSCSACTVGSGSSSTRGRSVTPLSVNYCTQSKCKAALPDGYKYKTCEKCWNISKLSMQKKRKRDKADEGPPCNSHLEEDSDTELKQKVSRFTDEQHGTHIRGGHRVESR